MPEPESGDNEAQTTAEESGSQNQENAGSKFLSELAFSIASFHAVVVPVTITMILSALAVVYINTDETREQGAEVYSSTYEVIDLEEGNNSQNFAASVANSFIMVSVICAMTFVVVILYKYRCMKIFFGYMIIVTALLLGYFTSSMWMIAIDKYHWRIDKLSFAYVMWNYAIVGTMAIFYPIGIPKWATQGYLIGSSVVLAWQLSYFNEWTAWTLLIMLALYDLFAVLTPCGPLKALANLMSRSGAPELPGLLYEASLPNGVQRPNRPGRNQKEEAEEATASPPVQNISSPAEHTLPTRNRRDSLPDDEMVSSSSLQVSPPPDVSVRIETNQEQSKPVSANSANPRNNGDDRVQKISIPQQQSANIERSSSREESVEVTVPQNSSVDQDCDALRPEQRKGKVALAIAKMYKLEVVDEDGILRRRGEPEQMVYSAEDIRSIEWKPKQLRSEVTVVFPSRGGRIEKSPDRDFSDGPEYTVYSRSGEVLRRFVVTRDGKVMQVVQRERSSSAPKDNTIKLGLVSDKRRASKNNVPNDNLCSIILLSIFLH